MEEKNCFDKKKLIYSNHVCHCSAVDKELLERADKPGSTTGDAVFCFFVSFFFCLVSFLNTIFPFGLFSFFLFSFLLLTLLTMHLDQYIF